MANPKRIDVHHHLLPEVYLAKLAELGITKSAGAPVPQWWKPENSLAVMDQHGIAAAVLSVSNPGVYFGDAAPASKLARECNEAGARMAQDHPGRLGWFAILPMPIVEASITEAVYALEKLNANGIVILASSAGKFLGDPDFEELMAELNRRRAIVFIHPAIHPTSEGLSLKIPGFMFEFLFDTTRAVTNLVLSGVLERYHNIRWIVAHAGGTIPYIWWRIAVASSMMPSAATNYPRGFVHYLKQLYYDTALSASSSAISALLKLVGPSQILFGSDFPFAPEPVVDREVGDLDALDVLADEDTRRKVARENALRLFPRLGQLDR
jgi:predicted TIM-barrel fold metal-dependent hydrolase